MSFHNLDQLHKFIEKSNIYLWLHWQSSLWVVLSAGKVFGCPVFVAAQIQFLDLQYENVMPKEMFEWSALVLKIRLENMDDYFDPYVRNGDSPDESVTQFFELTGNAFGASLGKVRRAAEIIISSTK